MEDNLQNENCRADVVNLIKRTPTSNMTERTKCCLARLISEDLSKELSWQKTPNRQPFGSTSLWAVVLDTLSSGSSDQDCSFVTIRKACMGWFQNARDRCGGRSKRRMTMPKMPLVMNT
ncbi:unnamed protein product [Calicophoron daubneyi]|uniref:Uncharacterized protein n=1 Tax=Calicophoron daubneyi TaxID=300641 RepID=A0AAV2T3X5_CALDB